MKRSQWRGDRRKSLAAQRKEMSRKRCKTPLSQWIAYRYDYEIWPMTMYRHSSRSSIWQIFRYYVLFLLLYCPLWYSTIQMYSFTTTERNSPGMSPENSKKIAHLELEISKDNLTSVRKWDNEQTDRHTRNLEFFGTCVRTSQECLQKISERYLIQNQRY